MTQDLPPLTARELILSVLQITQGRPVQVGFLVEVAEILGQPAAGVRVALTRLLKSELIRSPARGHYALAPKADPIGAFLSAWRQGESRVVPWTQGWLGQLLPEPAPARKVRRRSLAALARLGFVAAHPKLWVRPDCLAPSLDAAGALHALGLESGAVSLTLRPDRPEAQRWRALYEEDALNWSYAELVQSLQAEQELLERLPTGQALTRSFQVGRRAIEQLGFDPLLPADWVDPVARACAVDRLKAYDDLARAQWSSTLRASGWTGPELTQIDGAHHASIFPSS